MVAPINP